MIGFNKFQDDLHIIRAGLECAPSSSTNAAACAALIRVCEFAKTLENLDLHELPERPEQEPQGAPPCEACATRNALWDKVDKLAERVLAGPQGAPQPSPVKGRPSAYECTRANPCGGCPVCWD